MKTVLGLFALTALVQGQPGAFRYAHLAVHQGSGRASIGSLQLANGKFQITPASGAGKQGAVEKKLNGLKLGDLDVYGSEAGQVLVGSANSGLDFDLWVAVKSPDAAPKLLGDYAGGLVELRDNKSTGLITAFVEFSADGAGNLSKLAALGHSANIDDVNRRFSTGQSTYEVKPNGEGTLDLPEALGYAAGKRRILVSPDGNVVVGIPQRPNTSGLLVAVRRAADSSTILWNGLFYLADLTAGNTFRFDPAAARFSAGIGMIRTDGEGNSVIYQNVRQQGSALALTTSNSYRIAPNGVGGLAGTVQPNLTNFALTNRPVFFSGAHIAPEGQLTLEHGIFFGFPAVQPTPGTAPWVSPEGIASASAPTLPAPVAPGELISVSGMGLAPKPAAADGLTWPLDPSKAAGAPANLPTELGTVTVTINGVKAPLLMVSDAQIICQVPASVQPGIATVEVSHSGKKSNAAQSRIVAANPMAFTLANSGIGQASSTPAKAGTQVTILATGLGTKPDATKVSFGSFAAKQVAVAPSAYPGVFQIKATVPPEAPNGTLPVALSAATSYSDLADLAVVH